MAELTRAQRIGNSIKKVIGVEGSFKTAILPMIAYNSSIFLEGGSFYIISIYFLSYLTYVEGLSTNQAGIVVLCAKLCDAITDPAMGIITDRTRSKYGRHRRYLLWGMAPVAVSYFMMWYSFGISNENTTLKMAYFIGAYMLFSTAWTVVIVPHTAMLPQLAPEYSLRTQYNAVKTILDAVGSYSSFIISAILFGFVQTEEFSPLSKPKFLLMGIILCLWFSLPLIYTFKGTSEPSSLDMKLEPFNLRTFFGGYYSVMQNRAFRQYFMLSFFNTLSTGFIANSSYYFLRNIARRASLNSILVTIAGIAEAAGFPLNYALSMKFNKQLPAKIELPSVVIALLLSFFVTPESPAIVVLLVYIFYNFGLAGMASVTSNILPDVIDVDEMVTGKCREGMISTFSTFCRKTVSGLAATITGFILGGFGFKPLVDASLQPHSAVLGIRFTYAVLPLIFIAVSIFSAYRYKMAKREHDVIRRMIEQREKNGTVSASADEIEICESISGIKFENMWVGTNAQTTIEGVEV